MSWQADVARARAIAWKDLTVERHAKANFNSVAFLGALILMLFGFALGADSATLQRAASGVLWLAILFSGILAFSRSYQVELEGGAFESLLLYPGARWTIYVGKLAANLAFVGLMELVIVPVALVLYHLEVPGRWPSLLAVVVLGTFGFVALGTFYAAMASRSRAREVLLPLLLFPMMVPVLLAATEASGALLVGDPMGNSGAWIRLLIAFDAIFFVASVFAFEYVIEV